MKYKLNFKIGQVKIEGNSAENIDINVEAEATPQEFLETIKATISMVNDLTETERLRIEKLVKQFNN